MTIRIFTVLSLVALLCVTSSEASAADQTAARGGELPVAADGKPLNFDFETGTLDGWKAEGAAFVDQPIKGDTVAKRRDDMRSNHAGQYWIGTYERQGDPARGVLTSPAFVVKHPWASFLIAGGSDHSTRLEIVREDTGQPIFRVSGDDTEVLKPVVIDLQPHLDKSIVLRLVDTGSGGWGHINFDDFRFHASKPAFPTRPGPAPLDSYANAGLSAEDAARAMTVPEGFQVTLFAGEPDVQQPIAQAIDDRGRLWVAEAYSYPIRVPAEKARDRILIFEDTDGDGRFDNRKVFADKLNLVSGLELGFGGVFVGAAPELLFIPDADGDDHPDGPPEVLLDGWGYQDTHETLNAFAWGPDGWLYGCHGVFTFSRVGKPGTPKDERVPINAGVWRYHPTKREFEVFAEGTSNPWGVDFNDQGQAFITACVIPHLYHMIQGARYERQAGNAFNPYTYDDIKTIALHRHWVGATPHSGNNRSDAAGGGHAHAGAMIYLGGVWPEKYRNQIFMNNIHGARLNQDQLAPRGSGYVGDRAPDFLLANDSWSQIINLQYGPDGQMYLIDWYDKNQCHHRENDGHDRSNGRVFKVSYGKSAPMNVDIKKLDDAALVKMQLDKNDWYVRHARRVLQERGPNPAVHEALAEMAFQHADETRRLRGLWALHATGGLDEERIATGLANDSPLVRAWTIQLALEDRKPSQATMKTLATLAASDISPVVRLYLASAAIRLSSDKRWDILRGLVAHSEDASDHNLPLMYWYASEPLAEANAKEALALAMSSKIPVLLPYMVRRIGAIGADDALALLVDGLGRAEDNGTRLAIVEGLNEALAGRRRVDMPKSWPAVSSTLLNTDSADLRSKVTALALTFGDPAAMKSLREVLVTRAAPLESRQNALAALLKARDPQLAPTLHALLSDGALRADALRGLAAYEDEKTPEVILSAYARLTAGEKRDALATLVSRVTYAKALLSAVGSKQVAAADLSADLVRQLRNLKSEELDRQIAEVWGTARDTAEDKVEMIAKYKKLLSSKSKVEPDVALGRAVFTKTCQQCHTLFGTGGKVGPELTGSNRANLDYVLANVLDSSALIGKDYQATVIATEDGRVLTGIVRNENNVSLTLLTANEQIVLPKNEIAERELSTKSMMPDDLWAQLSEHEVRSLVTYLAHPTQTPVLATADTATLLFNGRDLTGWQGDTKLWSVENGELVGRTPGLDHNEWIKSDLLVGDFKLSVEVKLVDNKGNSGIQFRSEALSNGEVKGYQADIGAGWWGKLYEEHGRALLWKKSGEKHVKPGDWNTYEVEAVGSKIRTSINGQPCVELDDPDGAQRGILALQLHSGGATEVRYRNFRVEVLPKSEAAAAGN